ncbi:MAG: hypothetical protein RR235_09955 [Oscillospiraceae bacterium]
MENLISVLQSRLAWYTKAIAMATGSIAWENHFDWPWCTGGDNHNPAAIYEWRGAAFELQNTLDMMGVKR